MNSISQALRYEFQVLGLHMTSVVKQFQIEDFSRAYNLSHHDLGYDFLFVIP